MVVERLKRATPLNRVLEEHLLHELQPRSRDPAKGREINLSDFVIPENFVKLRPEGHLPEDDVVENDSHGVDVDLLIVLLRPEYLGSHKAWRSYALVKLIFEMLCRGKVNDANVGNALREAIEDVVEFDVAMKDALSMHVVQPHEQFENALGNHTF